MQTFSKVPTLANNHRAVPRFGLFVHVSLTVNIRRASVKREDHEEIVLSRNCLFEHINLTICCHFFPKTPQRHVTMHYYLWNILVVLFWKIVKLLHTSVIHLAAKFLPVAN